MAYNANENHARDDRACRVRLCGHNACCKLSPSVSRLPSGILVVHCHAI